MSFDIGDSLDDFFSVGHPNFVVDRMKYPPAQGYGSIVWGGNCWDLNERFSHSEGVDIGITYQSYEPLTREVEITLTAIFYANYYEDIAFNVYVIEDSIFGYQANAPDPNSYWHAGVARDLLGGQWGETVNQTTLDNMVITKTFNYTLPQEFNEEQIKFIGFLQRKDLNKLNVINCTADHKLEESYLSIESNPVSLLKLYPNPTNGQINIETIHNVREIRLFTMDGREQFRISGTDVIDLSTLPAGFYILKISTDNGVLTRGVNKK
jgi:hypothetical protein